MEDLQIRMDAKEKEYQKVLNEMKESQRQLEETHKKALKKALKKADK